MSKMSPSFNSEPISGMTPITPWMLNVPPEPIGMLESEVPLSHVQFCNVSGAVRTSSPSEEI